MTTGRRARYLYIMSALLNTSASEINVCAEYGYSVREFSKQPRVLVCNDYQSCFMMVHYQDAILPNRHPDFRNHFTLFRGKDSILVVRVETTLVYNDNDAVLMYDSIRVSSDATDRMRASSKVDWDLSFDRNITYSNERPANFTDYQLVGSGEWWFFDRGVVLNGITKYVEDCNCLSLFIYYELHPKFVLRRTMKQQQSLPAPLARPSANRFLYSSGKPSSRGIDDHEKQPGGDNDDDATSEKSNGRDELVRPIPTLNSQTMISMVNASSRSLIRTNEQVTAPDVEYQSVVPSLFWLKTRNAELRRCDISYFLPQNYKCAYGVA